MQAAGPLLRKKKLPSQRFRNAEFPAIFFEIVFPLRICLQEDDVFNLAGEARNHFYFKEQLLQC